ncbi:MAG: hypothetical protein LBJ67_08695 [Planctomycetaceae bacterium]|jgi:hypothetical protein|nr:hypothetical protein [Planctomycetaceae bacterium]
MSNNNNNNQDSDPSAAIVIIILLALLAAFGYGVYWLYTHHIYLFWSVIAGIAVIGAAIIVMKIIYPLRHSIITNIAKSDKIKGYTLRTLHYELLFERYVSFVFGGILFCLPAVSFFFWCYRFDLLYVTIPLILLVVAILRVKFFSFPYVITLKEPGIFTLDFRNDKLGRIFEGHRRLCYIDTTSSVDTLLYSSAGNETECYKITDYFYVGKNILYLSCYPKFNELPEKTVTINEVFNFNVNYKISFPFFLSSAPRKCPIQHDLTWLDTLTNDINQYDNRDGDATWRDKMTIEIDQHLIHCFHQALYSEMGWTDENSPTDCFTDLIGQMNDFQAKRPSYSPQDANVLIHRMFDPHRATWQHLINILSDIQTGNTETGFLQKYCSIIKYPQSNSRLGLVINSIINTFPDSQNAIFINHFEQINQVFTVQHSEILKEINKAKDGLVNVAVKMGINTDPMLARTVAVATLEIEPQHEVSEQNRFRRIDEVVNDHDDD